MSFPLAAFNVTCTSTHKFTTDEDRQWFIQPNSHQLQESIAIKTTYTKQFYKLKVVITRMPKAGTVARERDNEEVVLLDRFARLADVVRRKLVVI